MGDRQDTESSFVFYLLKIQAPFIRSDKTHFFFKVRGFLTNHRVEQKTKQIQPYYFPSS